MRFSKFSFNNKNELKTIIHKIILGLILQVVILIIPSKNKKEAGTPYQTQTLQGILDIYTYSFLHSSYFPHFF